MLTVSGLSSPINTLHHLQVVPTTEATATVFETLKPDGSGILTVLEMYMLFSFVFIAVVISVLIVATRVDPILIVSQSSTVSGDIEFFMRLSD